MAKKQTCRAHLATDTAETPDRLQTIVFCEKREDHKGNHRGTRIVRKDLFITIEWREWGPKAVK